MKQLKYLTFFITSLLFVSVFYACEDENGDSKKNSKAPEIHRVFLQDANSKVPDREVAFARLSQTIRLEGENFVGLTKVLINGYSCYFNPVFVSNKSMVVQINRNVPTADVADNVKNTIRLEKGNQFVVYNFEIRAAAPSITRISHTLPQAGEEITIYGTGLADITKIIFPGNIEVTEGITFDGKDGRWCTVTVPAGINESGSILVLGVNGGAYSPAYFNFKEGVVHDFDNVNNHAWNRGAVSNDLSALIPTTGNGPKSQGKYRSLNTAGRTVAAGVPEDAAYFARQNMWEDQLNPLIPGNTPADEVAIQMDIYVDGEWNSGYIRMVAADGWGSNRYCMLYAPWESIGRRIPFENPGCWYTVTFPFSDSKDFEASTFADILAQVQIAVTDKYNQWGPWLCNDDFNDVEAEPTNVVIYFDNLRVVPLTTPTYSDFADEDETE